MGSLTTAAKDAFLDSLSGYWLALFTDATDDAGGGTEVAGGSYGRQPITLDPASGGVTQNTDPISFVNMPGGDDVLDCAIFDDEIAGTMQLHGPLAAPVANIAGQTITFQVGDLALDAD